MNQLFGSAQYEIAFCQLLQLSDNIYQELLYYSYFLTKSNANITLSFSTVDYKAEPLKYFAITKHTNNM